MWLQLLALLPGLFLIVSAGSAAEPASRRTLVELHVQQLQQDFRAADGSMARPYGTIHDARDHIRQLRRQGSADMCSFKVSIGPGRYPPLLLQPQDSGTPSSPILYEASADGTSVISGGVEISPASFTPRPGHPNQLQADVSSLGLRYGNLSGGECDFGTRSRPHDPKIGLVFGKTTQSRARWPNINGTTKRYQWQFIESGGVGGFTVNSSALAKRISGWSRVEADPWIHSYPVYDWADSWGRPTVTPRTDGAVQVNVSGTGFGYFKAPGDAKFYGANLLSELDQPGEYYLDESRGKLYFYPPTPLTEWEEGPHLTQALAAVHVRADYITLKGLSIRYARGSGVVGNGVTGVRVEDCEITGHGQHGVVLLGNQSGVDNSSVSSVGCGGVWVVGGVARTLTHGKMFATHNRIWDFALWKRSYHPGVRWGGVGNTYSHNWIHNSPHNCITGGGNDPPPFSNGTNLAIPSGSGSECMFENNTLDTCAYECQDCGAFYTCGQQGQAWVNRGNKLRSTVFKNIGITSLDTPYRWAPWWPSGQIGAYFDDQISGWEVSDCEFHWAKTGIAFAGGRHNMALRNRFFDCATMEHEGTPQQCCGACIVLDNRGMNWEHTDCNTTLPVRVRELLYPGSPWAARYPELANITTDRECKPAYCEVRDNTYSGGSFLRGMVMGQFPSDWEVKWRDVVENNSAV